MNVNNEKWMKEARRDVGKIEKENKIYSALIPIILHNPSYRINGAICYIKYPHINKRKE